MIELFSANWSTSALWLNCMFWEWDIMHSNFALRSGMHRRLCTCTVTINSLSSFIIILTWVSKNFHFVQMYGLCQNAFMRVVDNQVSTSEIHVSCYQPIQHIYSTYWKKIRSSVLCTFLYNVYFFYMSQTTDKYFSVTQIFIMWILMGSMFELSLLNLLWW